MREREKEEEREIDWRKKNCTDFVDRFQKDRFYFGRTKTLYPNLIT